MMAEHDAYLNSIGQILIFVNIIDLLTTQICLVCLSPTRLALIVLIDSAHFPKGNFFIAVEEKLAERTAI